MRPIKDNRKCKMVVKNPVFLEDFLAWIHKQPKDKLVNMSENRREDSCGCLMVQYGNTAGFAFHTCGGWQWFSNGVYKSGALIGPNGLAFNVFDLFITPSTHTSTTTYAELISKFKPEHQQPCLNQSE